MGKSRDRVSIACIRRVAHHGMPGVGYDCACRIGGSRAAQALASGADLCRRLCNISRLVELHQRLELQELGGRRCAWHYRHYKGRPAHRSQSSHFSRRTEADYTEHWEERTYDLSKLRSLDLFLVYWMGPSIAHTIMSFGFDDGRYLDFSIELRRTRNDQYSAVAGFFKTHELVYIGADERDLMTLRKARHEQIQLYRLRTPPERARALLVEYIKQANDLAAHPRFYNTLTTNCTTTIFDMMQIVTSSIPFDWRIILTGHLPSYLYEHDAVDTRIPLEELRQRADVTSRVDAGLSEVEFSSRLREGVPAPR